MFVFKLEHNDKIKKINSTSIITDSKITAKKIFEKVIQIDLFNAYGNKANVLMAN